MFILDIFVLLIIFAVISLFVKNHRWGVATGESAIILVLTVIYALARFSSYTGGLISTGSYAIDRSIGISFSFGMDGLSIALLFLTTVIMFVAIYISKVESFDRRFYGLMLFTEVGLYGLLISRNFLFFYVFWEVIIIPVFVMIALFGGKGKEKASLKFFVYTQVGSVLLLLSIMTLFAYYGSAYNVFTLNMSTLLNPAFITSQITDKVPFWTDFLLFGFFFAFLVKMPAFPLHSWLPDAYTTSPYPLTIVLSGAISLMGGYGFFAVLMPIAAVISPAVAWLIIGLGIFSLVYFALTAMFQTNTKRMMSYASAASMGFILISFGDGVISTSMVSYTSYAGGIYQILAHGLIMGLIFASLYLIKMRTGTDSNLSVSGLWRDLPYISAFFLAGIMASLGLPGLAGFVSEASIVLSSYAVLGVIIFLVIFGMIITASYHIWVVQKTLNGPFTEKLGKLKDAKASEILILSFLFILILFLGIYPNILFAPILNFVKGVV